ncbi:hypothetical protein O3G_MSEX013245 [Manduca sexta]|uniref:C2H2-type domain-containing protein n=1 Tax=Manduca sexta TaxID=7130 RepID=A0A921ZT09_MANSE|nr:hypothetical protein O3G_MSEX013245 [Manduca sexta]
MSIKIEDIKKEDDEFQRKDPTSFLPEEEMSYEFKKKKKKKKKQQEDPFKDLELETNHFPAVPTLALDPEVNIKVEDIEVELNFNDFADNQGLLVEAHHSEDSQPEPAIKVEDQSHEAVILTFENVVSEKKLLNYEHPEVKLEPYKPHICKVCHLVFKSNKTLHMHQKRKHKAFRKSFKHICDYCGMSYETKNSLVAHIKRKHGPDAPADDTDEHTCDICALVFKGAARLRMHMRRKHGAFADAFKYVCSECGLTYDKHRSLVVHIQRKHSGVQPASNEWFSCPFCPKAFTKRETNAYV